MHEDFAPRSYLEVGVNRGASLTLSRTRTIGIDPDFNVNAALECDLQLVKATSDDFFARPDPIAWFPNRVIDLAFIDGLHVFEYALRDFINVEHHCSPASVAVIDDMLPRSVAEAARDRFTTEWAGDVYKVAIVLERYRPDLTVLPVNTTPTGIVLVAGLDPTNTVLSDRYDEILAEFVTTDPQDVPFDIMHRTQAADPDAVLASPVWADLASSRSTGTRANLEPLAALRSTATYVLDPPEHRPWPSPRLLKQQQRKERKRAQADEQDDDS